MVKGNHVISTISLNPIISIEIHGGAWSNPHFVVV